MPARPTGCAGAALHPGTMARRTPGSRRASEAIMRARTFLGPAVVALAVWCAAGDVTLAAPDASASRLCVPAPWWLPVAAIAAAWWVPAWRRHPMTALPAVFATVPWWPVPVPVAMLVWTGPMAWVPVVAACAAAIVAPALDRLAQAADRWTPEKSTTLAAAATLAAGIATGWFVAPRLPGGDEPHYLIITQSLLQDGDLRIENNHRDRDYAAYFGGDLAPDFLQRGADGEIYSIHAPGVSALVAPAYFVFGYRGASATILLMAAITGALVWRVAWLASDDRRAAWFAWAAIVLCATFLLQSVTIFPDGPGALAIVAACWLLVRIDGAGTRPGPAALAVVGTALAILPWLHTRFAVLAAGFGGVLVLALAREPDRSSGARARRIAALLVVPAMSAVGWFAYFFVVYGTPNPAAPYGPNPEASWRFVPGGLTGLLADQQFGLLATAPVLAAAAAGIFAGRFAWARRSAAGITLVYFAVVATYWMWWAGRPATPARFTAAALPALALPLSWAWARSTRPVRGIWLALMSCSVLVASLVIGWDRGALAWNDRTANAAWLEWLGPVADLPRAWPSFFWALDPARLSTEWAFATHALIWVALLVASGIAVSRLAGSWSVPARRSAVATWLLVFLTVAAPIGWRLTDSSGLDPSRSQLRVVAHEAAGRPVLRIASLEVERATTIGAMSIRREAPGRLDVTPAWLSLANVPPGEYALHVLSPATSSGAVDLLLGRGRVPWTTFDIGQRPTGGFLVDLPAGAARLAAVPDDALEEAGGGATLTPLRLYAGAGAGAIAAVTYGAIQVFLLDDNVFVEPDGFWVRGGRTAGVVLSVPGGSRSVRLDLRNGASANEVEVVTSGGAQTFALPPSGRQEIELAVPAHGRLSIGIASRSGFVPADVDGGEDRRFLGVRVVVGMQR